MHVFIHVHIRRNINVSLNLHVTEIHLLDILNKAEAMQPTQQRRELVMWPEHCSLALRSSVPKVLRLLVYFIGWASYKMHLKVAHIAGRLVGTSSTTQESRTDRKIPAESRAPTAECIWTWPVRLCQASQAGGVAGLP
jgi:hypothetical protein